MCLNPKPLSLKKLKIACYCVVNYRHLNFFRRRNLLIIYLDESGDLGFNFLHKKTSRYLIISLLVFLDESAHLAMSRAVKRTLKNKLPKFTLELKGNDLSLPIKKYFLKEVNKEENWRIYIAIADKKSWVNRHISKHNHEPKKKALYDEIAKRLFSQLDYSGSAGCIDIIVDRSKNKDEINSFDEAITSALLDRLCKKTRLTIKHRNSHEDAGLQAVDVFCAGVGKKYEKGDTSWYAEFENRIVVEIEYKF